MKHQNNFFFFIYMDYSSDNDSGDDLTQPQPQHHHHKFLSELGHVAEDIGKGVATEGIGALLF